MTHKLATLGRVIRRLPANGLKGLILVYRYTFSSIMGRSCRFQPTCSAYALEAIDRYGTLKGGWLAVRRIASCHPIEKLGGRSGYDPVP